MSANIYYGDIKEDANANINYRRVIHTDIMQTVLMSLEPGETIPTEIHHDVEQILYVVKGYGMVTINNIEYPIVPDMFITVPPNTRHYVVNTGDGPLKLVSIYSSAEHPRRFLQINPGR